MPFDACRRLGRRLGEAYWEHLRDFVWDQLDAGAIAIEEVGFARLLDSPGEAVEIIVQRIPPEVRARLQPRQS